MMYALHELPGHVFLSDMVVDMVVAFRELVI
jgi:hypothetical protein